MATFVLVHGAYHGGWCWKKVAPLLRQAGHEVYTPTLTGLGERAHLLSREVGLDTHVQDVVNVLEYEELAGVILVGHSYGGMVITGVAERTPERVGHLVYLDAVAPFEGERSIRELFQRHDPAGWTAYEGRIAAGAGWRIPVQLPVSSGEPLMGVHDAADVAWLRAHLTDQPAKTFTQRLDGDHAPARHLPRTCVLCPAEANAAPAGVFGAGGERIKQMGGQYFEFAGAGHDVMVTRPRELADLLLRMAASL